MKSAFPVQPTISANYFFTLPPEIALLVLETLSVIDRVRTVTVSRTWKDMVLNSITELDDVPVDDIGLASLSNLTSLQLRQPHSITANGLRSLTNLKILSAPWAGEDGLTSAGIAQL